MRILLLTNDFPLPVDAGGVVRLLGLAETLAARHEVHLLARERSPTPPELIAALSARLGSPVETFPAPAPIGRGAMTKAARWTRATMRRTPPWVLTARSEPLARRAVELAPDFDVAVTLDDNASVYAEEIAGLLPVVLDKQNVHGASWVDLRPYGRGVRGRALHALTLAQLRAWEGRTSAAAAAVVVTSDDEASRFAGVYGWRPQVVPSAIPTPRLVADPVAAPASVAWLGDHTYFANVDGLLRFVHEAWAPLGRSGVSLLVAGRRPPAEVRALARVPGVEILGYVDDLDALLARSAAAVVPLWWGVGIKMKTLTLMGAGLPLAATPIALEGVRVHDGMEALVAESPGDLAAALERLLADRAAAAEIGRRGREVVLAAHTWDAVGTRFEQALALAAERGTTPRHGLRRAAGGS